MSNNIELNISNLNNAVYVYNSCRMELEAMLEDLKSSIENVKENWTGLSSDTYFENSFPQFVESLTKHIEMIDFLENELINATAKFDDLGWELARDLY